MKKYILLYTLLMAAGTAQAQNLSGNVSVEAGYLPTLRSHDRLAALPSTPDLSLTADPLKIAAEGVITQINPLYAPMPATPWRASKEFSRLPGYVRLGAGSYMDITGSAGYRFINNSTTTFGAWLEHNSSYGFKPGAIGENGKELKRHRTDEWVGFYGSHLLDGIGTLQADIRYHFSHFNYYHSQIEENFPRGDQFKKQNLNDLKASMAFRPVSGETGFDGAVRLSDHFFGYNNRYDEYYPAAHENNLELSGFGAYKFDAENSAGLQLTANLVGYGFSGPQVMVVYESPSYSDYFDHVSESDKEKEGITYGRVAFAPYYAYSGDGVGIHLGARFDWTPNAGHGPWDALQNPDFGHFHVAPDVTLSAQSGKFTGSLSATGGTELRTMAANYQLDNYQISSIESTVPLFSPINAKAQIELGDFGGLSASAAVAYKITDNVTAGRLQIRNCVTDYFYYGEDHFCGGFYNLKGFSLQGALRYEWGDKLELTGDLAYQPQNKDKGYFNGYDRPRWIVNAKAGVTPIEELHFDLGYQYRGVRAIWENDEMMTRIADGHKVYNRYCLPDITNLYLTASYTFMKRFSVWATLNNILGTADFYGPYMPGEGLSAMGGVSLLF